MESYSVLGSYEVIFFLCHAVCGNSRPEVVRKARAGLVNMRTFHMEYDICSVSVSLFFMFVCCSSLINYVCCLSSFFPGAKKG